MRHVRKEFRLILRSDGELFCLLFDRLTSELDLTVLLLNFSLLLREESRFLFELFIRLLEFFLLTLEEFFRSLKRFRLLLESAIRFGELLLLCLQFLREGL